MKAEKEEPKKSDAKIVKQGYLEKKGVIRHNWLKRWFVLEEGHIMKYYTDNKSPAAKGSISLVNAQLYAHVEKKKGSEMPTYFNLRTDNRDYLIRAPDAEEKIAWVEALKANLVKDDGKNGRGKGLFKTNSFLGVVKDEKNAGDGKKEDAKKEEKKKEEPKKKEEKKKEEPKKEEKKKEEKKKEEKKEEPKKEEKKKEEKKKEEPKKEEKKEEKKKEEPKKEEKKKEEKKKEEPKKEEKKKEEPKKKEEKKEEPKK